MDFMNTLLQWLQLGTDHKYLALAIAMIGWMVSLTSDWSKFPITVPGRYQPLIAVGLGVVYKILLDHQNGTPWWRAIGEGVMIGLVTAGLYDAIIKAIFDGKIPTWMRWLSMGKRKPEQEPPPPVDPGP